MKSGCSEDSNGNQPRKLTRQVTFDDSAIYNGTTIDGRSTRHVRRLNRVATPRIKVKKDGCECGCIVF